jgi:hypothetical protein
MEEVLTNLKEIHCLLSKQCEKYITEVDNITNITSKLKNILCNEVFTKIDNNENLNENDYKNYGKEDFLKINNDFIENGNQDILDRRINYHKEMGTYKEFDESKPNESKSDESELKINNPAFTDKLISQEKKIPMINALHKFSPQEQNVILKKIFDEASYNIEYIMQIKPNNSLFQKSVMDESDRLLNSWFFANKA